MAKVWLVTGRSPGFGHKVVIVALNRGDTVIATARDTSKLSDSSSGNALTYQLDVTWPDSQLQSNVDGILSKTGKIDILVHNAGYILCYQLNVIRAVVPSMRAARSGVFANFGSIGGWRGTVAAGVYCATKACASILAKSPREEVKHPGMNVTTAELGYFKTGFSSVGHRVVAKRNTKELEKMVRTTHNALEAYDRHQPKDPAKGASLIVDALTGTGRCEGRELPARLIIRMDACDIVSGCFKGHEISLKE